MFIWNSEFEYLDCGHFLYFSLCDDLLSISFLFCFDSVKENCIYHNSTFYGVNFPVDGPVMKKVTYNWEPSCEKIIPIPSQGILKGDVSMYLLLKDGGRYRCQFDTVYKYVILLLNR